MVSSKGAKRMARSRRQSKSASWAAFDLQERERDSESEAGKISCGSKISEVNGAVASIFRRIKEVFKKGVAASISHFTQVSNGKILGGKRISSLWKRSGKKNESSFQSQETFDECVEIDARVEPECEEGDLYLTCRKDARRVMRAAAQHSKSAREAFQRGDHIAAQHFSRKAREERAAGKRLNRKAAHKILSITNKNNGIWKLDLHGLHAVEAVQALQKRLNKIESASSSNNLAWKSSLGKPRMLEVVTGVGKHSRGKPKLPTAVKTFLVDNGYCFEEARPRPGAVTVLPKFRHS